MENKWNTHFWSTQSDNYQKKTVCFKRLSSLTGWDVSTGLFRSIHIFLGFPSSSRSFAIYFQSLPVLWEMVSRCSEEDFPIGSFAFHLHSLKPDGFLMYGKQPQCPAHTTGYIKKMFTVRKRLLM